MVAVYGELDCVGLTVAMPEHVSVSLNVPPNATSETVTVCAAPAPADKNVSDVGLATSALGGGVGEGDPPETTTGTVVVVFVNTVNVVEPGATGLTVTEPCVSETFDDELRRRAAAPAGRLSVATLGLPMLKKYVPL